MRQPPTYTAWKITCHSPAEVQALQQWLSSRIDLERVLTDTVRVTPNEILRHSNLFSTDGRRPDGSGKT